MESKNELIGFFGHHKCATTWIGNLIDYVCRLSGRKTESLDNAAQYNRDLKQYQKETGIDFLFLRNAQWNDIKEVPFIRGFHLIRDPRDILVSGYFSHKNSHPVEGWPKLVAHREQINKLSLEEGLILEMDFSETVFNDLEQWNYTDPRILELSFEEMTKDPYQTMLKAFTHLGVLSEEEPSLIDKLKVSCCDEIYKRLRRLSGRFTMPNYHFKKIPTEWFLVELYRQRFETKSGGRAQGVENKNSHFRKGVAGDWENYFTERVESAFNERYGQLLEKLSYK